LLPTAPCFPNLNPWFLGGLERVVGLPSDDIRGVGIWQAKADRTPSLSCIELYWYSTVRLPPYSPVQSSPVLSCPVLSCPVLPCPALSCPVLPCPALYCASSPFVRLCTMMHRLTLLGPPLHSHHQIRSVHHRERCPSLALPSVREIIGFIERISHTRAV
jgi:hypothetical protein